MKKFNTHGDVIDYLSGIDSKLDCVTEVLDKFKYDYKAFLKDNLGIRLVGQDAMIENFLGIQDSAIKILRVLGDIEDLNAKQYQSVNTEKKSYT